MVDVHRWERPGDARVQLDDDFAAFHAAVARELRVPTADAAALKLFFFPVTLCSRSA